MKAWSNIKKCKVKSLPALLLLEDICDSLFIKSPSQHGNDSAGSHHIEISNTPPGQSLCTEHRKNMQTSTNQHKKLQSSTVLRCTVTLEPLDGALSTGNNAIQQSSTAWKGGKQEHANCHRKVPESSWTHSHLNEGFIFNMPLKTKNLHFYVYLSHEVSSQ